MRGVICRPAVGGVGTLGSSPFIESDPKWTAVLPSR